MVGGRRRSPVRILYLLDALHAPDLGGTEGQFVQLVSALDPARYRPTVMTFRPTPFTREAVLGCAIHHLHIRKLAHAATAAKLLKLALFVRREGFSLVHILLNDASLAAPAFCRLGGARVVVSRRDMGFWYTPAALRVLRISNRFVHSVAVNSSAVAESVQLNERVPADRIRVIPNGHDLARFDRGDRTALPTTLGIPQGDPVVGMVGHFHPWKRQADLVRAFATVRRRHPRAHLVFAGMGVREGEVRRLAQSLGSGDAVHFAGRISDPIGLIHRFTIGALCSDSEGFSNTVLEYFGCAKPVVCTDHGGNAELVADGVNGFLVRPGDVEQLVSRIEWLLDNPDAARSFGRHGRRVAERFTVSAMVQRQMALYDSVLQPC